jgi:hypothetical protein
MILFCPRCGTELAVEFRGEWFDTSRKCSDCGVALADPPAQLAPADDEVTYGLDEWPVADRVLLTQGLATDGLPYRWEAGVVLVVPGAAEAVVDGILDDLETSGDGAAPEESSDVGAVGDVDGGAEGDGPESDADGGEEAHAAMSDLFVAADRLHHSPGDVVLAADLAALADVVAASLPPYGIEASTWRQMHDLAAAVGEAADDDDTAERTATLRDFLRPYV